jgi:hypothetical protein
MKRTLLVILLAAASTAYLRAAPLLPAIQLIPSSGNVSGNPGTAVGWGLTLNFSDPSDWVILTGSSFTGSTTFGTYHDYLGSETIIAGPSPETSPVTVPFNKLTRTGLGEFDLTPTALIGADIKGNIVVHYSVFSQDPNNPNFNPDTSTVVADATLSAPADVHVTPEPASFFLIAGALLPFGVVQWRRRRARRLKFSQ